MSEDVKTTTSTDEAFQKLHIYSLTGFTPDALADEVFLVHDQEEV